MYYSGPVELSLPLQFPLTLAVICLADKTLNPEMRRTKEAYRALFTRLGLPTQQASLHTVDGSLTERSAEQVSQSPAMSLLSVLYWELCRCSGRCASCTTASGWAGWCWAATWRPGSSSVPRPTTSRLSRSSQWSGGTSHTSTDQHIALSCKMVWCAAWWCGVTWPWRSWPAHPSTPATSSFPPPTLQHSRHRTTRTTQRLQTSVYSCTEHSR